jgi:SagB-type dehydrogenase family enzyme
MGAVHKTIPLPQPAIKGDVSLEDAISRRRSCRSFTDQELSPQLVSQLLWAAQYVTIRKKGLALRAAPSAGAFYPLKIYTATKEGLFHYLPDGHGLELLRSNDLRPALCAAALGQRWVRQAPLDIVLCAVYHRLTAVYGERGVRYAHFEAGHAAQNVLLQAVTLGLGAVPIGSMDDISVKKVLSLPNDHEPLYIIPVGFPS